MATDFGLRYGATQLVNITLNSLANGSYRQSSGIVNTSGWTDYLFSCKLTGPLASTDANGYVNFYALGSTNNGATYTDGGSGIDLAFIPSASALNLPRIGFGGMVANSSVIEYGPFSVAEAFGGILPSNVQIVVGNGAGASLGAAGNSGWYTPVKYVGTP